MAEQNPETGSSEWLKGTRRIANLGVSVPYQRSTQPYTGDDVRETGYEQIDGAEVSPNNRTEATVEISDLSALESLFSAVFRQYAEYDRPPIPAVLRAVAMRWSTSGGLGGASGSAITSGDSWAYSLDRSYESSGNLTGAPDPDIWEPPDYLPVTRYVVALATPVTMADIVGALASHGVAASEWPIFVPRPVRLTVLYNGSSETAKNSENATSTPTSSSVATSTGGSINASVGIRTDQISKTIHEEIAVTDATYSGPTYLTETGSCEPAVIPATSPSALPTSGIYLYDPAYSDILEGFQLVSIKGFDFSLIDATA